MNTTRDPDRLFRAFLDEGPEVLPDRVLAAIADDIHGQRQRAPLRPWRFTTMRTYLAAAAVVLIVIAGGGILWATRQPSVLDAPTPSPSPSPNPSSSEVAQPDPELPRNLTASQRYHVARFGEPLSLVLPRDFGDDVVGDVWDARTFRLNDPSSGVITIHDDVRLANDLCHPTGVIDDVPSTFDAIEAWLNGSDGVTVIPGRDLPTVDNAGYFRLTAAKYWDVELGPGCYRLEESPPGEPVVWFQAGEHHRIFAVQTDSREDMILVFTWGAGYGGDGDDVLETVNPLTISLVQSFDFDGPTFTYE